MLAEAPSWEEGTYRLEVRFRYEFASPVHHLRHRLVVVPRAVHGDQRRVGHGVTVDGGPAIVAASSDGFGNHVVDVRAAEVTGAIEFGAWALVQRSGPGGWTALPPSAIGDGRLLAPTSLTLATGSLYQAARDLAGAATSRARGAGGGGGPGRVGLDIAERACSWAHGALAYEYGVTGVRTAAATAVAGGRGVCQDYAHVMIALCRSAGLAARYVSGHLVGEGGSHAWVEVIVPDTARGGRPAAVAFDPTHDRRADRGYLTVAVGRDYNDVAPTSGTFRDGGPGVLSASKRLALVDGEVAGPMRVAAGRPVVQHLR